MFVLSDGRSEHIIDDGNLPWVNGGLATESQFPGVLTFLKQPRLVVEIEESGVERGNTRGACSGDDAPTCMQDVAPRTDLNPQAGRIVGLK